MKDDLQTLPAIGPSLAQDLRDLGVKRERPKAALLKWWNWKDRPL